MPTLIAVAHGTRSANGRRQLQDLAGAVARRRPGLDVRLCYVDVQEPKVADIVPITPNAVVVPLLLSAGYHVRVDIAEAVAGTSIPVTAPLGPDPLLLDAMMRHLPPAGAVVLAAAGSSDPAWRADVAQVATRLPGPARVGYVSGSGPRVPDVVAGLRAEGAERIAIAAYLLADGLFYRSLSGAGADAVTPPLCRDAAVADLVLGRFDSAVLTTAGRRL
ncbi:cobalamin biosynthesis protein CbiX [Actinoplanes sp. SE50]|uniref:sirohydrochlorin chelatase n=1 Tax=unclassified Actinoplanes TaxID=2626549 RepID=UPI00023EBD16|nr:MULTISPECIES: CbiX/SirB N-terminal domain-containing protein [unclassified Actinoplanes]AEV83463.1 Sirohydrochlorin ferrochelatase [Actinoplanes sp. SE50/110]ATO81856.1 cobalamin biosynthesis protein CbiX [Actinoplanes sp. SE50]SLL99264.1 cobalamin biosynthesis protein CbiX [Actinoplanes sp. SE50/110]